MSSLDSIKSRAYQESVAGRMPVLPEERIYHSYSSFLWTCIVFAAATYAFLIGGYLPYCANIWVGCGGYLIGCVIGLALVTPGCGMASYKYGIDTMDVAKSSFGTRGAVIPLICALITAAGWGFVVEALTAHGANNIVQTVRGDQIGVSSYLTVSLALLSIGFVGYMLMTRPTAFERFNKYIAVGHILVTCIMLWMLVEKFGFSSLLTASVPSSQLLTDNKTLGLTLGIEFGVSNALTWWPLGGGLSRLISKRKNLIGPSVLGAGVIGNPFISSVAALAAVKEGTPDPTIWMIKLAGPYAGSLIMVLVLFANLATMILLFYLCGIMAQQIKWFAKRSWLVVIAVFMSPGLVVAFYSDQVLNSVMSFLSYNGVMFTGIAGVTFVDYFILRQQKIDIRQCIIRGPGSKYYFWGGVNWVAVIITGAAMATYLWLFNPINAASAPEFKFCGAAIPVMFASAALYYVVMRLFILPTGKGAYPESTGAGLESSVPPEALTL